MATKGRKPIPKTQKEILISTQEPLNQSGPGFSPTSNPNLAGNAGRSGQISFKGDTTKPFSIGIQDIDEAVFYYFQNVIKPYVIQNMVHLKNGLHFKNKDILEILKVEL